MATKLLAKQKLKHPQDLTISSLDPFYNRSKNLTIHLAKMREILLSYFTDPLPFEDNTSFGRWLEDTIPWTTWSPFESAPDGVTLFFLVDHLETLPAETFLVDIIKNFLFPYQKVIIFSFDHIAFRFDHCPGKRLFVGEAKVFIQSEEQANTLREKLPFLQKEIDTVFSKTGDPRAFLATKNFSLDTKLHLVREFFIPLIKRFPEHLDTTLFERLASIQTRAPKEFLKDRSAVHIGKIILNSVFIQNYVETEIKMFPTKRHVKIRFIPGYTSEKKRILGLFVGVNFFSQYEVFNEKHLLAAIKTLIPDVFMISGSTYVANHSTDWMTTLYVELKKNDGTNLTLNDRKRLSKSLQEELKKRVQHPAAPPFMARNQEEMIKNLVVLSKEITAVNDIPQTMIIFDQSSQEELVFTVLLARVKKKETTLLQNLLKSEGCSVRFTFDRVQTLRFLDEMHAVEANIFRMQMAKDPAFLRKDFSVNLYLARQKIVALLEERLGDIRDYNGGLLTVQNEIFNKFKSLFQDTAIYDQELLEDFFYSLTPIEAHTTVPVQLLSDFFKLFLKMSKQESPTTRSYLIQVDKLENAKVIIIRIDNAKFFAQFQDHIAVSQCQHRSLFSFVLKYDRNHYLGYLYKEPDEKKQKFFEETVIKTLKKCQEEQDKDQTLRLPGINVISLDPKIGVDKQSSFVINFLFATLLLFDSDGAMHLDLAESYEILQDQKTYIFKLRESYWSNGDPVVAYDFEYTWKKILCPSLLTIFSHVLYPIKNAKAVKEGRFTINEVGITAIDEKTLVVELEYPTPYFLKLVATTFYSPINHRVDMLGPEWLLEKDEDFVCSGPFKLKNPISGYARDLERNPGYWNQKSIQLNQAALKNLNTNLIAKMFRNK